MNETEQECIILNSVWEMIDGMVNWAMFVKHDRTEPTNMMFETSQHSRLFIILLGDFLSQLRAFKGQPIPLGLSPAPSNARPSDLTFLYYLRQVCAKPKFAPEIADLSARTEAFATWLEGDFIAPGVNLHAMSLRICAFPGIVTLKFAATSRSITWRVSQRTSAISGPCLRPAATL
jgi:hypothetical protein